MQAVSPLANSGWTPSTGLSGTQPVDFNSHFTIGTVTGEPETESQPAEPPATGGRIAGTFVGTTIPKSQIVTGTGTTGVTDSTSAPTGADDTDSTDSTSADSTGDATGPTVAQSGTAWQGKDSAGYSKYQADLAKGDGNAMVADIQGALQSGAITQDQATALFNNAQSAATQNGGGTLNTKAQATIAQTITAPSVAAWQQKDPTGASKYQADAAKGDGNAMVQDIHNALQSGAITGPQAQTLYSNVQTTAWQNGGGELDKTAEGTIASDTSGPAAAAWQKNDPSTQADNAWQGKDSTGYSKYQADLAKGDGNAMVQDIHNAQQSGALTPQQAAVLYQGVQANAFANGGGKLNNTSWGTMGSDMAAPAITQWTQQDPTSAAKFNQDMAKGDGNAMVQDIHDALQSGKITGAQAAQIYNQVQGIAYGNGGGVLNNTANNTMSNDIASVIAPTWSKADPDGYQQFTQDAAKGDGNSMVADIHNALTSGVITKAQATALYMAVPTTANLNGGGKCDATATATAIADTGDSSILDGGKTKALYQFEKYGLALFFAPAAAIVAEQGKNAPNLVDSMSGVQAGAVDTAASDFAQADPSTWQQFQSAMQKGDGNTAAQLLLSVKGKIPDSDITAIASQMQSVVNSGSASVLNGNSGGNVGGQINSGIRQQFQQTFNLKYDPFTTGEGVAQMGAEKFFGGLANIINPIGSLEQSITYAAMGDNSAASDEAKNFGIGLGMAALSAIPGVGEIADSLGIGARTATEGAETAAGTASRTGSLAGKEAGSGFTAGARSGAEETSLTGNRTIDGWLQQGQGWAKSRWEDVKTPTGMADQASNTLQDVVRQNLPSPSTPNQNNAA